MQVWSSSERWGKSASYCSRPSFSSPNFYQVWLPSLSSPASLLRGCPAPPGLHPPLPPHGFPQQKGFVTCVSSTGDPGWGQEYTGRLLLGYHGVFWQHWCGWIMWLVLQCQLFKEVMSVCLWLLWWSRLLWGCSRWPLPLSHVYLWW